MSPEGTEGALIGSTLGGYQLVALLGTGGMAEVYRGREQQSGHEMAVKVLPEHLARDPGYVARFRTEAERVAALEHPNVVPVYRFGEERGLLYIVMPVLKESLRDRMDREHTIKPNEAARLTAQVAAALSAAHKQGLVHRDVKPENILLNEQGRAMLTDFGIAREVDVLREANQARTLAATGLPVGTPEYMAPEQLRGGPADQRVDVYALGAVLYEMLTGHVPHDADTPYEVAARVLTEKVLSPREYNPEISPELEEVVLGALTLDPADRYPDMRSFAGALRRAVLGGGEDIPLKTGVPALGTMGPTPLARSLSTRNLGFGQATGAFRAVGGGLGAEETTVAGGRRRLWVALAAAGAVVVLVAAVGGSLLLTHGLALLGGGGPGLVPTETANAIIADATETSQATATAAPTVTPTTVPTSPPQPTATPKPSLSANPACLSVSSGTNKSFTVTFTGSPSPTSMTASTTSGILLSFSQGSGYSSTITTTNLRSGVPVTIYVMSFTNHTRTISLTVTNPNLTKTVQVNSCP